MRKFDGFSEGAFVGASVRPIEGWRLGSELDIELGLVLGLKDGFVEGLPLIDSAEGCALDSFDGWALGQSDIVDEGSSDKCWDEDKDGNKLGWKDGTNVGIFVESTGGSDGVILGFWDENLVGFDVGIVEDLSDGRSLGRCDGSLDGVAWLMRATVSGNFRVTA